MNEKIGLQNVENACILKYKSGKKLKGQNKKNFKIRVTEKLENTPGKLRNKKNADKISVLHNYIKHPVKLPLPL